MNRNSQTTDRKWVEKVEIENVNVKWTWSHFDGRDPMSGDGNYNFTAILDREQAMALLEDGWPVKEHDPYEEGDDPEFTLKLNISWKIEAPRVFLIKNDRKFRAEPDDLADIRRDSTEQIDVIFKPSFWTREGGRSGVTAYVEEMYVKIRQSRFASKYDDFEEA